MKPSNIIAIMVWLSLSGCSTLRPPVLSFLPPQTRQAITVAPDHEGARLTAWEHDGSRWKRVLGPVAATVGRNGFAPEGEKKEGDGRTPSGRFRLERAFGYAPETSTGLSYRQATDQDFWIDDPASNEYNTWVAGQPQADSYERLKRDDDLYALAIIIEYNTVPVTAGAGSAIFLHVWRHPHASTAGCVAVSRENIERLVGWLDRSQQPVIILGNDAVSN